MTLELQCRESATTIGHLRGAGGGRTREGSAVKDFYLCDNHAQLFQQVDSELIQEGWVPALARPPERLP
jgi:hypothetical protein